MSHARSLPDPWMTAEEFQSWPGDGTPGLHQLIDGEPVAMAPASLTHGRLQARVATRLNVHLAAHRPDCEAVVAPGVQPRADAKHNVRVPDISVGCGMGRTHYLEAPLLIVEILSPSNRRETREAVRACLTIPSLMEVLVLKSEEVGAEVLRRDGDGNWLADPSPVGAGEVLTLESIGFRCALDELYAGLWMD